MNRRKIGAVIAAVAALGLIAATREIDRNQLIAILGFTPLAPANNLSEVASAPTALANLGGTGLNSPAFTGTPTAPTPAGSDNSTKIATTAFVKGLSYAPLASPALTGAPTAPTPASNDNSTTIATTAYVQNQAYAPLASPALSGTPTAPTPAAADNSTKLATTAYVQAAAPTMTATTGGQVPTPPNDATKCLLGNATFGPCAAAATVKTFLTGVSDGLNLITGNQTVYFWNSTWGGAITPADSGTASIAGTFKNLYIRTLNAPGGVQTTALALYLNGVATLLACTITGAATTCNDTTHTSAAVAAGQSIAIQVVLSATAASTAFSWGIEFDPS